MNLRSNCLKPSCLKTNCLKAMVRSLVAMGVFLAFLTAAHLLPDPCLGGADDCCATESAASGGDASDCNAPDCNASGSDASSCNASSCNTSDCNTPGCNTPCCAGMVATMETMFRLDVPLGHTPAFEGVIPRHDFTPTDPLIRPPIAA